MNIQNIDSSNNITNDIIKSELNINEQQLSKIKKEDNVNKRHEKIKFFTLFFTIIPILFVLIILIKNSKNNITDLNKINNNTKILVNSNISQNDITNNDLYNNNREGELFFDDLYTSFNKAKNFLRQSMKGILIKPKKILKTEHPKVSVVIPLYNCKNIILRAITSIKNQNMTDFEIILVNDYSKDETLSYIEEMQKKDIRIKIINNNKNMGILYSRSIGALSAKGKYIFPLDNDDMFLDYDVFDTIYNIAENDNFDIVEFKAVYSIWAEKNILERDIQENYYSSHKLNVVLSQPELGNYFLKKGNELDKFEIKDAFLWSKCIKTNLYQKGLNLFGEERYKRYMTINEDLTIITVLFNIAESYKFVGKYGIFHIQTPESASWYGQGETLNRLYYLYFIDTAVDFTRNTFENKKILVHLILYMINKPQIEETLNINKCKNLFNSILNRILSCPYISQEDKNIIRNQSSKFNFINYDSDLD